MIRHVSNYFGQPWRPVKHIFAVNLPIRQLHLASLPGHAFASSWVLACYSQPLCSSGYVCCFHKVRKGACPAWVLGCVGCQWNDIVMACDEYTLLEWGSQTLNSTNELIASCRQ